MKPQSEKTSVRTYLQYHYDYVVVFVENNFGSPLYECTFFQTRKKAEQFNEEKLHGFGDVMTTRQALKRCEFITE